MYIQPSLFALILLVTLNGSRAAPRAWREGDIRLVGSRARHGNMGTVLVMHSRMWGAVCDHEWGMEDAKVVCRQLGFTGARSAPRRSLFGGGLCE